MTQEAVDLRILEGADLDKFVSYEVEEDGGFWWDTEDDELQGVVVAFEAYPPEAVRRKLFDEALLLAVQETQDVDAKRAQDLLDELDDEDDFPDLDIATTFSLFFTVRDHRGMYRMLLEDGRYWTTHTVDRRNARWDF